MSRTIRCAIVPLRAGRQTLEPEVARYLLRVHRLGQGDTFIAFDPEARIEAVATLVTDHPKAPLCEIATPVAATLVSTLPVTLLQGLGKGDKVDRVVRDATQLGVQRIVLVETERSIPERSDKHRDKERRYVRIAVEAARQSGRGDVPVLAGPESLESALESVAGASMKLAFHASGDTGLRQSFSSRSPEPGSIAACIGPEGGFSEAELAQLVRAGFLLVRLGPFILRTETAAIAALAAIAEYC
ncbi:MAG TPA: RsmE family RNA methyltransferase [Polyangiaceae bacterium]